MSPKAKAMKSKAQKAPKIPGVDLDLIPGIHPKGNKLLVVRHKEEKSKGGIVIPDTAQQPSKKATVLAVGPGALDPKTGARHVIEYAMGDVVLVYAYAGSEFKLRNVEYVLIEEADILAGIDADELLD